MRKTSRLFSPFVVPGFSYKGADGRNTKACGFLYSDSTRADTKCRQQQQQQQQGALRGDPVHQVCWASVEEDEAEQEEEEQRQEEGEQQQKHRSSRSIAAATAAAEA